MGAERGVVRQLGDQHNALYIKGDKSPVVAFDNLDDVRQDVADRMP